MNPATGIRSEYFQQILDLFKKYPRIREVVLFGSRAKGNYREGSDIDMALKGEQLDSRLLSQIELDYDRLNLPWKLDLVIYGNIESRELLDHIERVGLSVWKRKNGAKVV